MVVGDGDGGGAWVDLRWMLTASDEELLDRHGRWYVPRRDPRYLRRNALIAMGNAGDPHDPSVRTAVERWSRSDDEMLAEHARWALDQLDRRGHEEITA
jgi:epoxyqueuosine reductase